MRARRLTIPSLVLVWLLLPGFETPARAEFINFDVDAFGNPINAPTVFLATTALRDLYAPLGVRFRGPAVLDGPAILDRNSNFGVEPLTGRNFLAINHDASLRDGGIPRDPFMILFDTPAEFVSLFVASGVDSGTFRMDAFDEMGTLVGSSTVSTPARTYGELRVEASAGIARVVVSGNDPDRAFVFDNLSFNAVPEPASLVLLGVGAAGLLGYGWRRRKAGAADFDAVPSAPQA